MAILNYCYGIRREGNPLSNKNVQGVSYTDVSHDYFEKRGLQRHAGLFGLWALGVAAVVSGDFSG